MAPLNVVGSPINDDFVGRKTTPFKRARLAFDLINHGGRSDEALQKVNEFKKKYGTAGICCRCLVYNATGEAINFMTKKDWNGHIWEGCSYPMTLENGQWGAFLHVQAGTAGPNDPVRSAGGIVYRGNNDKSEEYDYMCSWSIPSKGANTSYTMIESMGYFNPDALIWGDLPTLTVDDGGPKKSAESNGCKSDVSIDTERSPVYTAILTLEGVEK